MSKNTNLSFLTDYITADITNGRIGINNASPAYAFDVTGIARTSTSTYLATASGNVGIGTTSPVAELQVGKASDVTIALSNSSSVTTGNRGNLAWYNSSNSTVANIKATAVTDNVGTQLEFYTRPAAGSLTQALTITSAGNVGIGTSSPFSLLNIGTRPGSTNPSLGSIATITNDGLTGIDLGGNVNANNVVGHINWVNYIGVGNYNTARIDVYAENQGNSGALRFWTANVSSSPTERMRITSAGNVGIGTSSPAYKLDVQSASGINSVFRDTAGNALAFTLNTGVATLLSTYEVTATNMDMAFTPTLSNGNQIEAMRIKAGGNVLIGTTTDDGYKLVLKTNSTGDTDGLIYMKNSANTASVYMFCATNTFMNTSDATIWMKRNGTTSRSINASGTINASGADYAEYMVKEITDDIAKGDIVGVNSNGKLTNIFADSVSFVIKSTDPSYVGGDTWFNVEPPLEKDFKSKNEFEIAYEEFKVKREEARAKVDRIAFSGQIPCNVLGANVGDYIIPINDNGKIKGQAISNPTFEQYQNSIAKVWKIMEDGRAWVAVKIG